jgi:EAL domain-containing protein (putative c-di-GMP-specific phosphodiesterase class I)/GGDEF domain-containing protein
MNYGSRRIQYIHAILILFLISMILLGFVNAWQKTNSVLSNYQPQYSNLTYEYLFETLITQPNDLLESTFIPAEINSAPVSYGNLNQWFKITLKNSEGTTQELTLILDNPMSDSLTLYEEIEGNFQTVASFGDQVEGVKKQQRISPHVSFLLLPNQTKIFLIHNQNTGAPYLPMILIDSNNFKDYEKTLHLIWGTFIGIILLMSAYNLVLYIGVGDNTYFLYVCYIVSMLMLLGVVHGFGYYIFAEPLQLWLSKNIIFLNYCAAYFTLQFALNFLRFTKLDGPIHSTTQLFSFILALLAASSLATPEYLSAQIFSFAQVITYLIVIALIVKKINVKFRWTKYYLLSWVPFFIGAAIGYLFYSGYIEYSFIARHALMFSVIFEMAFISMALADRLGETERRRLYNATHDFKLGLANESLLENAIQTASVRPHQKQFTLITIEISNYDAVIPYIEEDKFGRLILEMAKVFKVQLSGYFSLLKIDTDNITNPFSALIRGEILCFLVQESNVQLIKSALNSMSNSDNFNPMQAEVPYRIHCVFGAAIYDETNQNAINIINEAKRAVNQASEKKQSYQIYSKKNNASSERKVRLAQDLGNAIRDDELQLYHQPQLYLMNTSARSSEVLLRWFHPELGEVSPVEFVKIAEETGLIKRLTLWVLDTALEQYKTLKETYDDNIYISINISAGDLSRNDFVDDVRVILKRYAVHTEHITLELTETSSLTDQETFKSNFIQLKKMGFKFAIDDFGTGYSSLEYANDHPFTELKIDRSFITDVLTSKKRLTIVSATISMAKELGLFITAEGIEDMSTFQSLKTLGCDKVQGYYISKPIPFSEYCTWHCRPNGEQPAIGENMSIPFETDLDNS